MPTLRRIRFALPALALSAAGLAVLAHPAGAADRPNNPAFGHGGVHAVVVGSHGRQSLTLPAAVRPEAYGAKGDGVTDDTAALQQALDHAAPHVPVWLTPGRTYAHNRLLFARVAGEKVTGGGTLLATDESQSSVWLQADGVTLEGITVRTARTTQRWGTWDQMGVRVDGHTGVTLRSVTIDGAAAAGLYVGGSSGFLLDHVTVTNSRADGIHMTGGSHDGRVVAPVVRSSGDDGVAVVSYAQDGPPCRNITVTAPTVLGTTWGRGLSVVGGQNIVETDIDVRSTDAAAVYLGDEGNPWYTTATSTVTISGGSITDANTDAAVDHGAVVVLAGQNGVQDSAITVSNLRISNTRTSASRDIGVITYGTAPSGVLFSGLTITGGPRSAYSGNTPQSSYRLRSLVQNGVSLPDAG